MSMTQEPKDRVVRMPGPLIKQMQVIARAHERSLSAELRVALGEYVRRELPEVEAKQT
jgi:hypothetical protein